MRAAQRSGGDVVVAATGPVASWQARPLAATVNRRRSRTLDIRDYTMRTSNLDLVLINPSSRTQVYQSLGTRLAAVENPVWAGLMATFCRKKGLSVGDHRRRGGGTHRRRGRRARRGAESRSGGRGGIRTSALCLDADHDRLRASLHGDQAADARAASAPASAAMWRHCHSGRSRRRTPTSSPPARGCTRWSIWCQRSRLPGPSWRRCPGCGIARAARCAGRRTGRWSRISTARYPASPGICCRCAAIAPTTGTAWAACRASATPRCTRRLAVRITARSAASRHPSRAASKQRA